MILWISPSTGDEIVIDRGTLTVIPWKRDEPHRKIGGWFVGSHPDSDLRSARNMYGLLERFSHKQQPMWIFFCFGQGCARSEEHTSELQSRGHLVCRLLLEKKKESE